MTEVEQKGRDFGFTEEPRHRWSLLPDPNYLWMVFRRRLWFFVAAAVLVLALVAAAVLMATPTYVATASLLIEPRKTEVIDLQSVAQGLPADTNVVDTQVQIIGSQATALAVARRLNLGRDARAAGVTGETGTPQTAEAAERAAAAALLSSITVKRAGLTYIIDVSARSPDPDQAAAIANAFAAEYILLQDSHRNELNESAATFASRRASELREQAVADDKAVQRYMIDHGLMSAEGATMAEQEVSQLNQQIAQAQANLAQERGKLAAARGQVSRGGGADVGAVLASETIRSLRAQEATASAELASLQSRYGELYPDVKKAKQNLADIREQITAERRRIISTLEANVHVAANGLSSLQASRSVAKSSLESNSAAQVGLLELQRKAEASRAIYSAFLQRAKETAATTNLPKPDASISSLARRPAAPSWPNYRLAALLGLVAACIVGLITVGVAEYLDGSVSTREDIVNGLGLPYAGAIPDLRSSAGRESRGVAPYVYVLSHPFSAFAEAVRAIGAFASRRKTSGSQVVAIASALPREGKTSLAIALARVLAMGRSRVVLVDGDLRRHTVSDVLAPGEQEERLLKVLDGTMPLEEALLRDEATELMILPTTGPTTTEDFLSPERVERLYTMLRNEFDVVIVDTAPVLGVVDTRVLTERADVTLVMCHWRHTPLKAVRGSLEILSQAGANVVGVGLSMVNIREYASTGQGDVYGYHKMFTGYYVN